MGTISHAKNELLTPEAYQAMEGSLFEQIVGRCYEKYQKELRNNQCMDFDDLIMNTIRLFQDNEDALQFYQRKFHYIHVDEYQDTNHAQYTLVNLLAARFRNLCVVGDADQSIYGWRGANMQNILDFEKDYPDAATILLEQNYRSTQTILNAANQVIKITATVQIKIYGQKIMMGKRSLIIAGIVNEMKRDLSSVKCKTNCRKEP